MAGPCFPVSRSTTGGTYVTWKVAAAPEASGIALSVKIGVHRVTSRATKVY